MVFFDGFDVTKELQYGYAVPDLAARGVGCLIVDGPGNGESVRFRNLPLIAETEHYATPVYEYLAGRREFDPRRIGVMALSLGGYYAPRAASLEPRYACCVAWGAQWDYHDIWARRLEQLDSGKVLSLSVPPEHLQWVLGVDSRAAALKKLEGFRLDGIVQKMQCPFLMVHGEGDEQIPLALAEKCFAAVGSKQKTLKVFTREEGGFHHCQVDDITIGVHYHVGLDRRCAEARDVRVTRHPHLPPLLRRRVPAPARGGAREHGKARARCRGRGGRFLVPRQQPRQCLLAHQLARSLCGLCGDPARKRSLPGHQQRALHPHREARGHRRRRRSASFTPGRAIGERLNDLGLGKGRIGLAGVRNVGRASMASEHQRDLVALMPDATFEDALEVMQSARLIKSAEEIAWFEKGGAFTDRAIAAIEGNLKPGMPEDQLSAITSTTPS